MFIFFFFAIIGSAAGMILPDVVLINLAEDYFSSRSFIFLSANVIDDKFNLIKTLSEKNFLSTSMNSDRFIVMARRSINFHQKPVVVVLNSERLDHYQEVSLQIPMAEFNWFYFTESSDESMFQNFSIPFNCKFLLFSSSNHLFKELYKINEKSNLMINLLGSWDDEKREISISGDAFFKRRRDFHGIALNYFTPKLDPCQDLSVVEGLVVPCIHEKIWKVTVETLNATTNPVYFSQRSTLYLAKEFDGGEGEASITPMYMSSTAVQYVDFFWPTFYVNLEVYTRYTGVEISWTRYLKPFGNEIWCSVVIWVTLCCITFEVTRRIAMRFTGSLDLRHEQSWSPIFAFLGQGTTEPTDKIWERLLLATAFLAPAVLIPAYNAALTSFLAFQNPKMPFKYLEEMVFFPNQRLTGLKSFVVQDVYEGSTDVTSKYLLTKAMLPFDERPDSSAEGFHRMCTERLSFIETEFSAAALKPKCKFYKLIKPFASSPLSLTMPKGSPYAHEFNMVMTNLRYSGVLQTLKSSVTKSELVSLFARERYDDEIPAITFESIVLVLTLLSFAAFLSVVLLIFEILMYKNKERRILYPFIN